MHIFCADGTGLIGERSLISFELIEVVVPRDKSTGGRFPFLEEWNGKEEVVNGETTPLVKKCKGGNPFG